MKKLYTAASLLVGLSISVFAAPGADGVPVDSKGSVTHPQYAGAKSCVITNSTGTAGLICDTGAGLILAIYGSSVASTDQLMFRDSATINTTSSLLFTIDKGGLAEEGKFYPAYKNALQVKSGVAPTSANGNIVIPSWTIIYRPLD
jgi:hypothetical protein